MIRTNISNGFNVKNIRTPEAQTETGLFWQSISAFPILNENFSNFHSGTDWTVITQSAGANGQLIFDTGAITSPSGILRTSGFIMYQNHTIQDSDSLRIETTISSSSENSNGIFLNCTDDKIILSPPNGSSYYIFGYTSHATLPQVNAIINRAISGNVTTLAQNSTYPIVTGTSQGYQKIRFSSYNFRNSMVRLRAEIWNGSSWDVVLQHDDTSASRLGAGRPRFGCFANRGDFDDLTIYKLI
jgi:hypothetical protein